MIPHLSIATDVEGLKQLPEVIFELEIPQIMSVMSALVFSIMIGLAAAWNKSKMITEVLEEFQAIVLYCFQSDHSGSSLLYCPDLLQSGI